MQDLLISQHGRSFLDTISLWDLGYGLISRGRSWHQALLTWILLIVIYPRNLWQTLGMMCLQRIGILRSLCTKMLRLVCLSYFLQGQQKLPVTVCYSRWPKFKRFMQVLPNLKDLERVAPRPATLHTNQSVLRGNRRNKETHQCPDCQGKVS